MNNSPESESESARNTTPPPRGEAGRVRLVCCQMHHLVVHFEQFSILIYKRFLSGLASEELVGVLLYRLIIYCYALSIYYRLFRVTF